MRFLPELFFEWKESLGNIAANPKAIPPAVAHRTQVGFRRIFFTPTRIVQPTGLSRRQRGFCLWACWLSGGSHWAEQSCSLSAEVV